MDDRYYIALGPEQKGPYTFAQLQSMWRSGTITADALYCQKGFDKWVPISSLTHLLDGQSAPVMPPAQQPALAGLESDKRILPAHSLCFFLGVIGAHAFYAGRPRQGILFLAFPVLAVLFAIVMSSADRPGLASLFLPLALIFAAVFAFGDLIRLLVGAYKDGSGRKITRWT